MPAIYRDFCSMTSSAFTKERIDAISSDKEWKAALLVIGDEILAGKVQDTATAYLANWLAGQGIELTSVEFVPDDTARIITALRRAKELADYVFTTGGLGPTHDDKTVDAIAQAIGREVCIHEEAENIIREHYGKDVDDAKLRMARTPTGATLIHNPRTVVPGINVDGSLFLLAGVPLLMRDMLKGLEGRLSGSSPSVECTIGAWIEESRVAEKLAVLDLSLPGVQIGSYPFWIGRKPGCNFVCRTKDENLLGQASKQIEQLLLSLGVQPIVGGLDPADDRR